MFLDRFLLLSLSVMSIGSNMSSCCYPLFCSACWNGGEAFSSKSLLEEIADKRLLIPIDMFFSGCPVYDLKMHAHMQAGC